MAAPVEKFLKESQALSCIHCGLCLGSCPTYLETGNENDSPRGRIYLMRALQSGRLPLEATVVRHLDLCLGCRACEAACPSGVQYGALLEGTRDFIERAHRRPFFERFLRKIIIEGIFPFPWRLRIALLPARLVKSLRLESVLPKFAREAMELIPAFTALPELPEISSPKSRPVKPCGFVQGCVMSVMFGETNHNSVKLLNEQGFEVRTPRNQNCCGALYAHSGNLEKARACARQNIQAFESAQVETIVINAAGCGSMLKEYGHLLEDDPVWVERAKAFSAKVRDLTEVLKPNQSPRLLSARVTYHDACHLAHAQRIGQQPRDLIRSVAKNFVELPESDLCCGSAGSYNLTEPEMAERLQKRKIENIIKSGAEIVVTTNPGCLLQIQAGLKKSGAEKIKAIHIADFLAEHPKSS
jgi:glycolate oxidase iron-sulfur subunit